MPQHNGLLTTGPPRSQSSQQPTTNREVGPDADQDDEEACGWAAWDRQRPEVEHPQHAGQHPDLADPDVLRNHPVSAVEPGVAFAQEREGEDPEQWGHEAGNQQPWKLAACPRLVPRFRHRVPRVL
jgi:hypothetical protein